MFYILMFKSLKFFHTQWANNVGVKINFTVTKLYCELLVTKWSCTQLTLYQQSLLEKLRERVTSPISTPSSPVYLHHRQALSC